MIVDLGHLAEVVGVEIEFQSQAKPAKRGEHDETSHMQPLGRPTKYVAKSSKSGSTPERSARPENTPLPDEEENTTALGARETTTSEEPTTIATSSGETAPSEEPASALEATATRGLREEDSTPEDLRIMEAWRNLWYGER